MAVPTSDEQTRALQTAVRRGQSDTAGALVENLPDATRTEALLALSPGQLAALMETLGDERVARLIERLQAEDAARILRRLSRPAAAEVLGEMEPDDAADVVMRLGPDLADELLRRMEADEAHDIRALLAYSPTTAGGRMTPEYVAVRPDATAGAVLAGLRRRAENAETIYYVYVVDDDRQLQGVLSLRELVLSPAPRQVRDMMIRNVLRIQVDADQEEAARMLSGRGLLALPVVDAGGHMLGIITADDIADVLQEEVTEDIARLGGSEPLDRPYLRASVFEIVRKRVGWLLILFVAEAYTGTVLRHFEATLSEVVALAFFIPLLIGTGGNVGTQTVTTLVRAMAVEDVGLRHLMTVLFKELRVGLILGVVMAATAFLRSEMLGVDPAVGIVVAVT
ncbi:MAG: magnesium transporter, partial [Chloroflexi bacterium]|nr:magnesium transporter [Chloroflexota bacterium]